MKCQDARLSAYLDGELERLERLDLEAHLGDCERCARELERLNAASAAVKAWQPAAARRRGRGGWIAAAATLAAVAFLLARPPAAPRAGERELRAGDLVRHAGRGAYVARDLPRPARIRFDAGELLAHNARFDVEERIMQSKTKAGIGVAVVVTTVAVLWGTVDFDDRAGRRTTLEEGRHEIDRRPVEAEEKPAPEKPPVPEPPFDRYTGVTGIVLDAAGAPVPDATVELTYFRHYAGVPPDATTRSGPDGRFRIGPVRHGFTLAAFKSDVGAGHGGRGLTPGADVTIRLAPAARLEGRLVDADDGSPVAGAIVVTRSAGGGWTHEHTLSDDEGRFVLETCGAEHAYLWIRPPRHQEIVLHPVLRAGETTRIEIPLPSSAWHGARVVDADAKEPVRLEKVVCEDNPAREVRLLKEGRFEVRGTSRFPNVWVHASGYPVTRASLQGGDNVIELSRGRLLRVIVRDEQEQPVPGVAVTLRYVPLYREFASLETDDRGIAESRAAKLVRGNTILVAATLEGFAAATARVTQWKGEVKEVVLTLPRAGVVEGRVVGADGAPAAGAQLTLGQLLGSTGADGHFRIADVPPGTFPLKVRAAGHVLATVPEVAVVAGETATVDDIVLRPGHSITGYVVDAHRNRLSNYTVWTQGIGQGRVLADGTFVVEGLEPGRPYTLTVHAGAIRHSLEADAGVRDLEVRLANHAAIRGRVVPPPGHRLPLGLGLGLAPVGGRGRMRAGPGGKIFTDGSFLAEGLHAGRWQVNVQTHDTGYAPASTVVELKAGETAEIELQLVLGGGIDGTLDRGGIEGWVAVKAVPAGGGPARMAQVDVDGGYRFDALSPGEYRLEPTAFTKGVHGAAKTVTVVAGRRVSCDLAFVAAGSLIVHAAAGTQLRLVDAEGRAVLWSPSEGLEFQAEVARRMEGLGLSDPRAPGFRDAFEKEKARAHVEPGPDGTWRRFALLPGTYYVVAGKDRHKVEITGEETAEIDLR